jgi:molybdopterin-guanine dinucleotide biosynthesis protein A
MARIEPVEGFVLAGGNSSRFGNDKALAALGGERMLTRMCKLLAKSANSVAVVCPPGRYEGGLALDHIPKLADRWPGEGPLGGILTALHDTQATTNCSWNIIISCDMPFLTHEWIENLCERARCSAAQVVMPRSEHGLEPLCACWRTSAAAILRGQFDTGVRKVTEALKPLTLEVLDEKDWKRFDSAGRLFWNMNTPADYEEAQRALKTGLR